MLRDYSSANSQCHVIVQHRHLRQERTVEDIHNSDPSQLQEAELFHLQLDGDEFNL